jgi:hypothetical protein
VYDGKQQPALALDCSNCSIHSIESKKMLKTVLNNGLQDIKYLARVYHAFISRTVLQQVYDKLGTYFPGPSPDMANAIACTLLIKKYVYIRLPIIISGYSFKSAGGMGLRNAHKGSLKEQKHLPSNIEERWDNRIPKFWLGYTIWPQSALDAFHAMGADEMSLKMNYYAMYAKIYLRYKDYRFVIKDYTQGLIPKLKLIYECLRFAYRWGSIKAKIVLRRFLNKQYSEFKRISLREACIECNRLIDSMNFKDCLNQFKEKNM